MPKNTPIPVSYDNHPDCVIVAYGCRITEAFNVAGNTLRPDNLDVRGVVWIPDEGSMSAQQALAQQQAAYGNEGFFISLHTFGRPEIMEHLSSSNMFEFDPEGDRDDSTGLITYVSNTTIDAAAVNADYPHIDGIRNGVTDDHCIRGIRHIYGHIGDNPQKPAAGTIFYEGVLGVNDLDVNGRVIEPFPGRQQGTKRLGQAWQIVNPGAILFVNIGGQVAAQLPHVAQTMPVMAPSPYHVPPRITRVIDNIDFRVN